MNRDYNVNFRKPIVTLCFGYAIYCGANFMLVKPPSLSTIIFVVMQSLTILSTILWILSGVVVFVKMVKLWWIPLISIILNLTYFIFDYGSTLGKLLYLEKNSISINVILNGLSGLNWVTVVDVTGSLLLIFLLIRSGFCDALIREKKKCIIFSIIVLSFWIVMIVAVLLFSNFIAHGL